jgi:signal transduction histidine kinase/CheY-like chemotaxis protein
MKFDTIRARMLAAALLPVLLVVLVLVSVFWMGRVDDLDLAHAQRTKLLSRQVAMASEYGLFSGNTASLKNAVNSVQKESDVRWVGVFDADGRLIAHAGAPNSTLLSARLHPKFAAFQRARGVDAVVETVALKSVAMDDFYTSSEVFNPEMPALIGYVGLEVSRDGLKEKERYLLMVALGAGLVGLLIGAVLAARMADGVVQPILRVFRRIERIGTGDFSLRQVATGVDPLLDLQLALDQMAFRLAWGRDELERRVAEVTRQLREKKEIAERATLAKTRFLAAASHDLRQPTHALGLFIARLGQIPANAQIRELVGNLDASVQAMQDLLDGLLDLSRLDAGAVQVQLRLISLQELIDALAAPLQPVAQEKGLRLRLRPSGLWVMSDPVLLQRMLMNLTHNALRYTQQGTVLVSCRRTEGGQCVRIDVSDSGVGISGANQAEIFTEFFQVSNPGRDRTRGMGLGLSIVERSAKLLGHVVSVRSELGCGTRFSITLPLAIAPDDAVELAPVLPASRATSFAGLMVLVIEDDAFSSQAMSDLLGDWGCRVRVAASTEEACGLLSNGWVPDAMVSDYRLGDGRNGLEAIAAIRNIAGYDVPACLLSGDTDAALMLLVKNAGLTLLHKPVRPAKLRSLLRNLVNPANVP